MLIHKQTTRGIDDLKPFPKNSRTHNDQQIDQVAKSINEYGFTNPVLIDENNTIIAGHCRLLAAKSLGLTTIPCVELNGLNEVQRHAYVIADNKMALNAGWNNDTLLSEISFLKENNFDLELIGFNAEEIDMLTPQVMSVGLTDDDAVPELPVEPITKLGDIWILGQHRLMCGDSTMIDDVEKLMDCEKADMVFTDPPYGVEYQSNMRTKSPQFGTLENDNVVLDIATNLFLFMKDDAAAFIWTAHSVYPKWRNQFDEWYKNTIIWHKAAGGMGDLAGNYATDYEMALFCVKGKVTFKNGRGMAVWRIDKDSNVSYEHPTQKPVTLAEKAINDLVISNASVLDLFGGSGSTLIACEKTNRKCYMMELAPNYCDVIVKRWEQFTGKKAALCQD